MKLTDKESYSLPVIFAIGLHLAVFIGGAVLAGLTESAPEPPKRPPIVNATIIDVSDTVIGKREAEQQKAAAAAKKAQEDAKRKIEAEVKRKAEKAALEKQKREAEAARQKQQQAQQKAEAERNAAIEKQKAAAEKARQEKIAKEKKAAEKAKQAQLEKERKAAEEKARREAEQKRQQELERQKQAELERKRRAEEQAKQEAERRRRAEEAVQQAVAEEEARRREVEAGQMVQSISGLINQRITNAWIRPPSARNGMKTLLRINFLPNGEVADVQVLKGSGNTTFDKYAVDAVYKVGQIEELADLESYIFERNFRQVDLLFNPQDLRN